MRAILVCFAVAGAPGIAAAEAPMATSSPASTESMAPPPFSMPDLSGPGRIGFDVEVAVATVEVHVSYPGGVDYNRRRSVFVTPTVSGETHLSKTCLFGVNAPYVISDHPLAVSGMGNIALGARWASTSLRNEGRLRTWSGVGVALLLPSAKKNPDDAGKSDPELRSEIVATDFTRFSPVSTALRFHVDWRAGVRRFFQIQVRVDVGVENDYGPEPFILPTISVGAGSYVWRQLAVVVEGIATPFPGTGHDIGENVYVDGTGAAGLRYVDRRFYTGVRGFVMSSYPVSVGAGADFSYLF